jgi:hypothetical protein
MRVEQRIGRLDRIDGQPTVEVSNYFYIDTVEQQIYDGIAKNFDWFTQIVGDAQPVLSAVEQAMTAAAMTSPGAQRSKVVADRVAALQEQARAASEEAVKLSDIADTTVERPPDLHPVMTLSDLRRILTANPLTADRFDAVEDRADVWRLALQDTTLSPVSFANDELARMPGPGSRLVTFDRTVHENASDGVRLLTYASPELAALLASAFERTAVPNDGEVWR